MKLMLLYILLAFALVFNVSGCTYATGRYTASADNIVAIRSWKGQKINVGKFSDATNGMVLSCNYKGNVTTIDGESYAQFIRNAFITELKFADAYSADAPITLSGQLDEIDNSSAFSIGWMIAVTVNSSNGNSISVVEDYKSNASPVGTVDSTCGGLATAFVPSVQNLIEKIVQKAPESLF